MSAVRPPRRLVAVLRAVLVLALVAVWSVSVGWFTAAAIRTDVPAPVSPIATLAHTRTACRVIGIDQAGQVDRLRVVDLTAETLRCVLDGMRAPEYVWIHVVGTWPLDGRCGDEWTAEAGTVTATWFRDPVRGLDLTVRVVPASGGGPRA